MLNPIFMVKFYINIYFPCGRNEAVHEWLKYVMIAFKCDVSPETDLGC